MNRSVDSLSPKNLALFSFLILGFFIGARMGVKLAILQPFSTPIWLPAGGAIAAFIIFGYRVWPAIFVGSFLGHVSTIGLVNTSFIVSAGATLEGLAGAYLVNKFAHGVKAFETAKDVLLFVLFACICAPLIDVAVGFGVSSFGGRIQSTDSTLPVFAWWLAHGIFVLLVAPFLIMLVGTPHHRLNLREFGELTVLLLGLLFVCLLVFGPLSLTLNKDQVIRAWLCVPFLIWAGFRFCPLEAAGTTLILFGSAIWGTLHGYGTFVSKDLTTSLVLLDTFVGVIGTMTLVVAALIVERRQSEERLLGIQSLLHVAVEGKGRELAETAHALEVEVAGHEQTKRSLRDKQERLQLLAASAQLKDRSPEAQVHGEKL